MATSTSPIIRLDMRASRSRRRVKRNYAFSAISAQAKFVLKNTGKWSIDHLKGVEGAEETKEVPRIEMLSGIKTIGRVTDSRFPHDKVVINAPTVSGDHARLSVLEGQLYCEDLGSTNGTRLNGKRIKPGNSYQVTSGSNLTFGDEYLARYTVYQEEDMDVTVKDEDVEVTQSE